MIKKKHLLFFISLALLIISQEPVKARCTNSFISASDSSIVIYPLPGQNPDDHGVRFPVLIPISVSFQQLLLSLELSFMYNLGEIEVEVLNSTTGSYTSIFVDTQFLYSVIPITLGSGHYIITFTLSSGQQYQGEFDI